MKSGTTTQSSVGDIGEYLFGGASKDSALKESSLNFHSLSSTSESTQSVNKINQFSAQSQRSSSSSFSPNLFKSTQSTHISPPPTAALSSSPRTPFPNTALRGPSRSGGAGIGPARSAALSGTTRPSASSGPPPPPPSGALSGPLPSGALRGPPPPGALSGPPPPPPLNETDALLPPSSLPYQNIFTSFTPQVFSPETSIGTVSPSSFGGAPSSFEGAPSSFGGVPTSLGGASSSSFCEVDPTSSNMDFPFERESSSSPSKASALIDDYEEVLSSVGVFSSFSKIEAKYEKEDMEIVQDTSSEAFFIGDANDYSDGDDDEDEASCSGSLSSGEKMIEQEEEKEYFMEESDNATSNRQASFLQKEKHDHFQEDRKKRSREEEKKASTKSISDKKFLMKSKLKKDKKNSSPQRKLSSEKTKSSAPKESATKCKGKADASSFSRSRADKAPASVPLPAPASVPLPAPAPAPFPAPIKQHAGMRPLDKFIVLQSANGSFEAHDSFLNETGLVRGKILESMPSILKENKDLDEKTKEIIWVTSIALAFLEVKFLDLKEEWDLLSDKSTKFVRKHLSQVGIDQKIILTAALSVFK